MKPVYITGLENAAGPAVISSAIRDCILKATDNLSWLSAGETVLLKPALNSADPYPSTTHPLAVSVTAELLAERGAAVVIGDQSGIEHVLHHPGGVVRGSTVENYQKSGMGFFTRARFAGFEEGGWEEGFYHHRSSSLHSWQERVSYHGLGQICRPHHQPSPGEHAHHSGGIPWVQEHGRDAAGGQQDGVPCQRADERVRHPVSER